MTKKHQVRSYYDQYSSQYDTFYGPIQYEKFQHIRGFIQSNPVITDFGGGTGIVSDWVHSPLINLDLSYEMLYQGLQKRKFLAIAADLEHLPLRNQCISTSISLTAVQNVNHPKLALQEISRVLTQPGSSVITFLNKKISRDKIEEMLNSLSLQYEYIPFHGEDYCYSVSSSSSSSS